jgi:hypothetical protein
MKEAETGDTSHQTAGQTAMKDRGPTGELGFIR